MNNTTIQMHDVYKTMRLNFEAGVPLMLKGASGIGKTEIAEKYARDQGPDYGYFELNVALASLPDVIGLQMPHTEKHVNHAGETVEIIVSKFAYPYFMRDKFTGRPAFTYDRGMVVLEEWGQGQPDVKRALAPVIREKRIMDHKFCQNCDVLFLSNRPEDRSGVTKDFDFLINRRNEITVNASLDGWLVWANDHGVSTRSMAYAARNTSAVFANKSPEKQGPWLTPRSLVTADNIIEVALSKGYSLEDDLVRTNIAGAIGEGEAHKYIAFARIRDSLPRFKDILDDPDNAALPQEPDQRMFLSFDLASKATPENIKPIVRYIKRMPSDFAMAFYKSAIQRDHMLSSTREFGDWAVDNMQLLQIINERR